MSKSTIVSSVTVAPQSSRQVSSCRGRFSIRLVRDFSTASSEPAASPATLLDADLRRFFEAERRRHLSAGPAEFMPYGTPPLHKLTYNGSGGMFSGTGRALISRHQLINA